MKLKWFEWKKQVEGEGCRQEFDWIAIKRV